MMRGLLVVGMLGLAMGCSSSDDPAVGSGNGACAQRSGTYLSSFVTRSGNCGDIPELVVVVPKQPTDPGPGCTGAITYSGDNCQVTIDTRCPGTGTNSKGHAAVAGLAKWSTDGSLGTGTETLTLTTEDGTMVCVGTYDFMQRRQ